MFERVYNKTHFRKVLNQALEEERLGLQYGGIVKTGPNKDKHKFMVGRNPERVKYFDNYEDGKKWEQSNRKNKGYDKPKGKTLRKSELNKASQYFFGKNYDELTDPKQRSKAYERVRGAGRRKEGKAKFKVKTQDKPLTKSQQAKIKKEFPNAKFGPKRKYGFSPTDPQYQSVFRFAERGYKKSFKGLPRYAQQELINAFPDIDFDFERNSKYGIAANDPNYKRVQMYFDDPKPFRYGFDLKNAGGWTLSQMDRAALQGNTNYEPILQKKNKPLSRTNKIIGIKDKLTKKIYNIKNINKHPDFPEIQKVYSVAEKSRTPLTNYPTLVKLLPKGFDASKMQLNDLLQFIADEKGTVGLNRAKRAIEIHHVEGVKNRATGNFQLLRSDLNKLADTIGQQISKGKLDRSAELVEKNIRTVVDGKKFGPSKVSPQQDFKNIIRGVEDKLKIYNQKDFSRLKSFLANPRAAALFLPAYLGYEYVPEILRQTGVVQREYEPTASLNLGKVPEIAPSIGERAAGATAATGATIGAARTGLGKKAIKLGGRLLAPAFVGMGMYDTGKALQQGKGVVQSLEEGILGSNLTQQFKEYRALSPEGEQARRIINQAKLTEDPIEGGMYVGPSQQELEKAQGIYNMELLKARQKVARQQADEARRIQEQGIGAFSLNEGNYGP